MTQRKLVSEALEARVVLDGAGGGNFVAFAPFLDSELGDDPHVETVGPDATQIQLDAYASIGSYLDTPEDVDVFQFNASGDALTVNGQFNGDVSFQLFDAQGSLVETLAPQQADAEDENDNEVLDGGGPVDAQDDDPNADFVDGIRPHEPDQDDGDGFVGCDWGPFAFCDIFPTEPGDIYFVSIGGNEVTEYYFDLFQNGGEQPETRNGLDSELGEDPHPDRVHRDATVIDFQDTDTVTLHSFIDAPDDIDVFQFEALGSWAQAFSWQGEELGLRMQIVGPDGEIIASNNAVFIDPLGLTIIEPFVDADLEEGETYFLEVSSSGGAVGEYGIDLLQQTDSIPTPVRNNNADSQPGEDPHANLIGPEATPLQFGDGGDFDGERTWAMVDSYIDEPGDIDVFEFTAEGNSLHAFIFSVDGSFTPSLSVHDANGDFVGEPSVNDPAAFGFVPIELEIVPGERYYLVVDSSDGGSGEYLLEVNQHRHDPLPPVGAPDSEIGDDPHADEVGPNATVLQFDGELVDGLGELHAHVDSYIDTIDDIDVFQFVATGDSLSSFVFSWNGSFAPQLSIYDADGASLTGFPHGGPTVGVEAAFGEVELEKGQTYFVVVSGSGGVGEYILDAHQQIFQEPVFVADSRLGDDPHADIVSDQATEFEFRIAPSLPGGGLFAEVSVGSYIDVVGDVDVFQFVAVGERLNATVRSVNDASSPTIRAFDALGAEIDVELNPADPRAIQTLLVPGMTYYVSIESSSESIGGYEFNANQTTQPEFGNDAHANEVGPDATDLELSPTNTAVFVEAFLDSDSDVDVFQFVAAYNTLNANVHSFDNIAQPTLTLYDSSGSVVTSTAADPVFGLPGLAFLQTPVEAGERYFLAVSGSSVGQYGLDAQVFETSPPPIAGNPDSAKGDDIHANLVGDSATKLELQDTGDGESFVQVDSFIDSSTDVDVFHMTASGDQLSIHANAWNGSFALALDLHDADGLLVVSSSDSGFDLFGIGAFIETPIRQGESYFIAVRSLNGDDGEYLLDIAQQTFVDPGSNPLPLGEPDSNLGDDPHTDLVGPQATALDFVNEEGQFESFSSVDSFIDLPGDVDVFQWVADESSATVSVYSWDGMLSFSVDVYDSAQNLIAQSQVEGAGDFWGFANLTVPTLLGETYYAAVVGSEETFGEYVLNVQQQTSNPIDPVHVPDAQMGDDIHVDTVGPAATLLVPDDAGNARVTSYLDVQSDVDSFQFAGTGGTAFAIVVGLEQRGSVAIRVLSADGTEIQPGSEMDADPFGFLGTDSLRLWTTKVGETYFLEISGADTFHGLYSLELYAEPITTDLAEEPERATNEVVENINRVLAGLPDTSTSHERNGAHGDANLDGRVDAQDYRVWNANKFTMQAGPAVGDFNNDGAVDGSDLNIWIAHRFQVESATSVAPPKLTHRVPRAAIGSVADSLPTDDASPGEMNQAKARLRGQDIRDSNESASGGSSSNSNGSINDSESSDERASRIDLAMHSFQNEIDSRSSRQKYDRNTRAAQGRRVRSHTANPNTLVDNLFAQLDSELNSEQQSNNEDH